ncbi:MarR family transcriptional regulator [Eubacteriales bacterium DFI.9.88]|uniref:MarR family winged helix-turn-helix transcriptional regulator n=1 Tax=Hominibacterium faecale TaxID=2839743 RepID=UPI0022B29B1A|nr:MarR family transcriptional regulator [Hominibacterium faecale]MDE8733127.1 MarR family transcriptional regulator [Eubacteriales bacterium DFI.9.88]
MQRNRTELNAIIYRINKLLKMQTQDAVRKFGITTDQWIVLGRIYNSEENMNQKMLAESCFKEKAAITRILDILEKQELLERRDSPADRREYLIYITKKGRELYEQSLVEIEKLEGYVNETFSKEELKEIMTLLARLEKALMTWN